MKKGFIYMTVITKIDQTGLMIPSEMGLVPRYPGTYTVQTLAGHDDRRA